MIKKINQNWIFSGLIKPSDKANLIVINKNDGNTYEIDYHFVDQNGEVQSILNKDLQVKFIDGFAELKF